MDKRKIIFILPNIYECINGVSTKYTKFINYLKNNSFNFILFTTFKDNENYNKIKNEEQINIIKVNGLTIPFYKDIKIPIINKDDLLKEIIDGNEIIVFNGEFIWVYNILKKIKKKFKNLKLYPTMHTDYIFYNENFYKNYSIKSILNFLNHYLENKTFNGIIVTGNNMKEKYTSFTNSIFNANEVNLDIFHNVKNDEYHSNFYNFIYCGRISKEKNIEEILDCCLLINNKFNFNFFLNIIGDGPYLSNLKNIIELQYKNISSKIIFYGSKSSEDINQLYQSLDNRIFIFTSLSETFGKTPMEAGATGIPIFIKKCDVSLSLYNHMKNAFLFEDKNEFIESFTYFCNLNNFDKKIFISNTVNNIKKYDQNIIFNEWVEFLIYGSVKKNIDRNNINIFDMFTFHSISKLINCTGNILGE